MREYRIGPGASSLILIILVLALATLGALSIMTAKSEMGLIERTLSMHESYYAATALAQDRIAEIDAYIIEAYGAQGDTFDALAALLPEWASIDGDMVSFNVDAGAGRMLVVELTVMPRGSSARFDVTLHALESAVE